MALAVVTSGGPTYADDHLTRWGIAGHLTTVVTAEDVLHGKPDPEGYLLACRRLGVAAGEAVVFEDSAAGLHAGRRAGARCFAVGQAARTPGLRRLADHAVQDLAQAPVVGPADTDASRHRAGTRVPGQSAAPSPRPAGTW
ncbi:HAD family hydrolase [Streptomyces sp. 900105755]